MRATPSRCGVIPSVTCPARDGSRRQKIWLPYATGDIAVEIEVLAGAPTERRQAMASTWIPSARRRLFSRARLHAQRDGVTPSGEKFFRSIMPRDSSRQRVRIEPYLLRYARRHAVMATMRMLTHVMRAGVLSATAARATRQALRLPSHTSDMSRLFVEWR